MKEMTMVVQQFPPVEQADADGLLAIGGDLEVATLRLAYANGIFPWPDANPHTPLLWFAPPRRAILKFSELHIPQRLKQELKKKKFSFAIDQNFSELIKACAAGKTRLNPSTWISEKMIAAYTQFHQAGYAHSFECYNAKQELVGGIYGVNLGHYFAGESMFYLESGASKAALLFCIETLQSRGATWLDIQMLTPLLSSLGAREIPREEFMQELKIALKANQLF